jgi:2-keto-3-deoxy-6-phosphogluconate aldolase
MERYETLFAQLKNRQEGAFVPFVTLGDPGPEQSLKIIDALIEGGADALELGIPSPTRWRTARPSRARPCAPSPRGNPGAVL